ncbi:hypothetical protein [Algoriphagus resistens]|uniref:hypothetical protein n=1 Tax=Algoriphagus resistens TaxID=1750590 RepID=UPI000716A7D7|nr:hypothetical protein [Algoriphagus resistens]
MNKLFNFSIQAIPLFLGFTFWADRMAKPFYAHQFFGWIDPVWLVPELEPYGMGFYVKFIAQITLVYLLVTVRYKLLGSTMMLPLIGNILMLILSLHWSRMPFVLDFLLVLDLIILWQYRDFFRLLIDEGKSRFDIKPRTVRSRNVHLVWLAGLGLPFTAIQISYLKLPIPC